MNSEKTGNLIRTLRREQGMTQRELAQRLHLSDKTVSKWERGAGCPDVSLLPELSELLGVSLETLLGGELDANDIVGGNMKELKFYVCPQCGNLLTAAAEASVSCCGKTLSPLEMKKAPEAERLRVEQIENELYITTDHPMTKEHYITFVALLTGDSLILRRQYPEWDLQTRIPGMRHGILAWHCNRHGLYYQLV